MEQHPHQADSHMHDFEAHVRAVEEDLEYYRAKRLEPRIFRLIRSGVISFYDLLKMGSSLPLKSSTSEPSDDQEKDLESRVRALEDGLDDYVREIGLVSAALGGKIDVVTEDGRKERGDYDEFFRISKKEHHGNLEERVRSLTTDVRDYKNLLEVLTRALIHKGIISESDLNRSREAIKKAGPWNGGKIVARVWVDPDFKSKLISQGRPALRELGIPPGRVGKLGVLENTDSVHNVIVCTLCSCYPYDLLGDTPWWYKQDLYKKRIIANPRAILEEMFQLSLPGNMEVRVHDSTSDVRYMVIPRRPADTEGMPEEQLAKLVTVDSLIGAAEALHPSQVGKIKETEWGHAKPRPRDY